MLMGREHWSVTGPHADDVYVVDRSGIQQSGGETLVVSWTENHIAIKSPGFGENPGSRYSGLEAYYPAEVTVYEIETSQRVSGWCVNLTVVPLLGWESRKPQTKVKAPQGDKPVVKADVSEYLNGGAA